MPSGKKREALEAPIDWCRPLAWITHRATGELWIGIVVVADAVVVVILIVRIADAVIVFVAGVRRTVRVAVSSLLPWRWRVGVA